MQPSILRISYDSMITKTFISPCSCTSFGSWEENASALQHLAARHNFYAWPHNPKQKLRIQMSHGPHNQLHQADGLTFFHATLKQKTGTSTYIVRSKQAHLMTVVGGSDGDRQL